MMVVNNKRIFLLSMGGLFACIVSCNSICTEEHCIKIQGDTVETHNNKLLESTVQTREIKVGALYKHYSGKLYRVLAIAHDSEDPSLMRVIYQGLYDCPTFGPNPVWDRNYTMFAEMVVINGKEQPRFADVDEV